MDVGTARMYFAHEKNMNLGMSEDRCDRLSSYVEILTSRTSECDLTWKQGHGKYN